MLEDKGHTFSNVQTDNGLMDAERSMAVSEAGKCRGGERWKEIGRLLWCV